MLRITLVLVLCLPLATVAQSLTPAIIARTGQSVPDVPGATYTTIGVLPRLGTGGHVAFNSFISGATGSSDFGYWVGDTPSNLHVALREDSAGGGPITFSGNANVGVDATGRVSMWSAQNTSGNMDQALWDYLPDGNGGSTTLVAEGTTIAPGFAGGIFSNSGSGPAANDGGVVAFTASVIGGDVTSTTNDFGLFAGTPGNLKLIAREGAAAPGATGTSPVFSTTTGPIYDKRINASGQVGFAAALSGAGVDANNDRAVYVWTPDGGNGTLALAAQTGSVAPGTSATIKFSLMDDSPGFSDAGQVAFRSSLTSDVPGEIGTTNNYGIWAGAPGSVQLVARSGGASPIGGLQYRTPSPNPRINATGQVAFFSLVAGPGVNTANDTVFWVTTPSGTEVVAREGSPAPGTTANFNTLEPFAAINSAGQLAFTATLVLGSGVTNANDRGLWAGLPGELSLVAREGDVIDVDPGPGEVLKTISTFSFANGYGSTVLESASAAFNDAGQIAWQAQFTDATRAIFISTLPSAPASLDGDYNDDGVVDAADYVTWRKFNLTSTVLPNDPNPLPIDDDQYNTWRTNFAKLESGSGGLAVPEPAAGPLFITVGSMILPAGGRRLVSGIRRGNQRTA